MSQASIFITDCILWNSLPGPHKTRPRAADGPLVEDPCSKIKRRVRGPSKKRDHNLLIIVIDLYGVGYLTQLTSYNATRNSIICLGLPFIPSSRYTVYNYAERYWCTEGRDESRKWDITTDQEKVFYTTNNKINMRNQSQVLFLRPLTHLLRSIQAKYSKEDR